MKFIFFIKNLFKTEEKKVEVSKSSLSYYDIKRINHKREIDGINDRISIKMSLRDGIKR